MVKGCCYQQIEGIIIALQPRTATVTILVVHDGNENRNSPKHEAIITARGNRTYGMLDMDIYNS